MNKPLSTRGPASGDEAITSKDCAESSARPARKRRCYIMGPMRGKPFYNFEEFDRAEIALTVLGYDVVNPAELDREIGFNAYTLPESFDWTTNPPGFDLMAALKRDLDALLTCDHYFTLSGWEHSTGARAEKAVADWAGLTWVNQKAK